MSKTKVDVKDGRLVVLAQDAIAPGVTSLPLDQVRSGAFEITPEGDAFKLSFRPEGRMTGEPLASYATRVKAEGALQNIYGALGGGSSRWVRMLKTAGLIIGGLLLLLIVLSLLSGTSDTSATGGTVQSAPPVASQPEPPAAAPLPVGVPFPVDDFVRQTQGESE